MGVHGKNHIWLLAEEHTHEARVGLTYDGAKALLDAGFIVTVAESSVRAIDMAGNIEARGEFAPENSWPQVPRGAIIFGLKELPEDGTTLVRMHNKFGHAFKG